MALLGDELTSLYGSEGNTTFGNIGYRVAWLFARPYGTPFQRSPFPGLVQMPAFLAATGDASEVYIVLCMTAFLAATGDASDHLYTELPPRRPYAPCL